VFPRLLDLVSARDRRIDAEGSAQIIDPLVVACCASHVIKERIHQVDRRRFDE
jgi:hypothetical protein